MSEVHVNYETSEPYPVHESAKLLDIDPKKDCRVTKMRFATGKDKKADKSTIIGGSMGSGLAIKQIPN